MEGRETEEGCVKEIRSTGAPAADPTSTELLQTIKKEVLADPRVQSRLAALKDRKVALAWISTDRNWANADGLGAIGRGAGIGLATTGL